METDFKPVEVRVAAHFSSIPTLTHKHIKGWCKVAGIKPMWWWSTKRMRKECLKALQNPTRELRGRMDVEGAITGRFHSKKVEVTNEKEQKR